MNQISFKKREAAPPHGKHPTGEEGESTTTQSQGRRHHHQMKSQTTPPRRSEEGQAPPPKKEEAKQQHPKGTPHDPTTRPDATKSGRHQGARLHAKIALCAELACGRSLRLASSGCIGARWFEDASRMSMAVVLREALCVYAESAWVTLCQRPEKGREKREVNTRGNEVVSAWFTPGFFCGEKDFFEKIRKYIYQPQTRHN